MQAPRGAPKGKDSDNVKIIIEIETDNQAFQDGNETDETIRILHRAIEILDLYGTTLPERLIHPLHDTNGNPVGSIGTGLTWQVTRKIIDQRRGTR